MKTFYTVFWSVSICGGSVGLLAFYWGQMLQNAECCEMSPLPRQIGSVGACIGLFFASLLLIGALVGLVKSVFEGVVRGDKGK